MIGNIIIFTALIVLSFLAPQAHAATEKECITYHSEHMIKITTDWNRFGKCDWLVDRYLTLNYTLSDYNYISKSEVWILVK